MMPFIVGFCIGHAEGPSWCMLRITGMLHDNKNRKWSSATDVHNVNFTIGQSAAFQLPPVLTHQAFVAETSSALIV